LLDYLDEETPIYRFPLGLEDAWSAGGRTVKVVEGADSSEAQSVFKVGSTWQNVRVPAGSYTNTAAISGTGPLAAMSPYYRDRRQTRFFAHGHGLVQRVLRRKTETGTVTVVEKLVESRIMPR
jgi:hypothetical protein